MHTYRFSRERNLEFDHNSLFLKKIYYNIIHHICHNRSQVWESTKEANFYSYYTLDIKFLNYDANEIENKD